MKSPSFRVSRLALAYLGAAQYLRLFWLMAAIVPLFGLVALIVGTGVLKVMGLMALLWPLSLPARAIFATGKAGRLLQQGAWASLEGTMLYVHGEEGSGVKLDLRRVRRLERLRGFLVLTLFRFEFLALPLEGLGEPFVEALEKAWTDAKSDQ